MTGHEDIESLAALAEGSLGTDAAARVREHLAGCRSCTAAYADAVRYRAAWLAHPDAFRPSPSVTRSLDRELRAALESESIARRPFTRPRAAWLAAASLTVVAAAVAFAMFGPGPSMSLALPPAVREAGEASSSHGLVLPGGEQFAHRPAPGMRSLEGEIPPALRREVDSLLSAYERGRRSADDGARLVAGLLATSDLDAAGDYAREGLRRHPDDVRLLVLLASARFRADDLAGAEDLLRRARRRAPRDPVVALDLALVLRQRGEIAESAGLLDRVARSRVRPLAERAERELGQPPRSADR